MYYEERIIDGVLCWRSNPDDEFTPYTAEQLSRKYEQEKEQTICLRELEDMLRAQLASTRNAVQECFRGMSNIACDGTLLLSAGRYNDFVEKFNAMSKQAKADEAELAIKYQDPVKLVKVLPELKRM